VDQDERSHFRREDGGCAFFEEEKTRNLLPLDLYSIGYEERSNSDLAGKFAVLRSA